MALAPPQTMLVWALSGDLWFGRRELLSIFLGKTTDLPSAAGTFGTLRLAGNTLAVPGELPTPGRQLGALEQVSYFWSYYRNEKMAKNKVIFSRALYTFIRSLL